MLQQWPLALSIVTISNLGQSQKAEVEIAEHGTM